MIIIGEKINGSIPSVAKAIAERDEEKIKKLAIAQSEANVDFIDVCASVEDSIELETMKWLIDLVQSVTDTPIAVDSPNPRTCVACMEYCKRPGIINSVSGEGNKIDIVFPVIADTKWQVMALLCDDTGIPKTAADRIRVLDHIMAKAKEYGIAQSRIHIDPLVEMLCTAEDGIAVLSEEIGALSDRQKEALMIAGRIRELVGKLPVRDEETGTMRPARYGDIVILLRSTVKWNEDIRAVFAREGIPAYAESRTGYFAAEEIRVVLEMLRVLDPALYVGRCPQQVDAFVKKVRAELGDVSGKAAALETRITDLEDKIASLTANTESSGTDQASEELANAVQVCHEVYRQIYDQMKEITGSAFYTTYAEHSVAQGKSEGFLAAASKPVTMGAGVGVLIACCLWFLSALAPEFRGRKKAGEAGRGEASEL